MGRRSMNCHAAEMTTNISVIFQRRFGDVAWGSQNFRGSVWVLILGLEGVGAGGGGVTPLSPYAHVSASYICSYAFHVAHCPPLASNSSPTTRLLAVRIANELTSLLFQMLTNNDLLHLSSYLIIGCILLMFFFSVAACSLRCCTRR